MGHRNRWRRAVWAACLWGAALPAMAGVYGDDLAKCVVSATTAQEKAKLVEWMFFAIALNPEVAPLASIPAQRREQSDRGTAKLFERLLTDACATQAREAIKYEGSGAIAGAFQLLGQVAAQEMFADPAVAAGTMTFAKYIDEAKMAKALGTTATAPAAGAPTP